MSAWVASSIAYSVVAFLIGCRLTCWLAWRWYKTDAAKYSWVGREQIGPTGEQWFGAAFSSACLVTLWPLVAFAFLGRTWLLAPPKDIQTEQQSQRIKELERELDLV